VTAPFFTVDLKISPLAIDWDRRWFFTSEMDPGAHFRIRPRAIVSRSCPVLDRPDVVFRLSPHR